MTPRILTGDGPYPDRWGDDRLDRHMEAEVVQRGGQDERPCGICGREGAAIPDCAICGDHEDMAA